MPHGCTIFSSLFFISWSQKETLKLNNAPLPIIIDGEAFLFKDSRAVVKELSAEDKAALEKASREFFSL